ncbi:MAG: NADH-quinone oxidoreductase subunit J [Ignavibacteriales bacterium]|nr:NADH-quinone oxidoreductase subunit J [Ignavibacteriales bacterium]
MDFTTIVFYLFAAITLGSGAVVVFSRNIVHSAFSLLFAFFGVAGLYVLLLADFLAVTQLLIYVGGILVLLIFGVMLTSSVIDVQIKTGTVQVLPALFIVGALAAALLTVFWSTEWKVLPDPPAVDTTAPQIGELLLTTYLLPFEIASVILLVALVGAAMIARREKQA